MTNTFKNKNGQFQKSAYEKVTSFLAYNKNNDYRLLSDFYNSRSTNCHSIYSSELFERVTDKSVIEAAGFSKLAKTIIRVNTAHPAVVEMMDIFEAKEKQQQQQRAEIAAYNDRKRQAVIEESNSITIDEDFKAAVKWACEVTGEEKSNRMASAMKGLLMRVGKEKIESDFWQVARILKKKANF